MRKFRPGMHGAVCFRSSLCVCVRNALRVSRPSHRFWRSFRQNASWISEKCFTKPCTFSGGARPSTSRNSRGEGVAPGGGAGTAVRGVRCPALGYLSIVGPNWSWSRIQWRAIVRDGVRLPSHGTQRHKKFISLFIYFGQFASIDCHLLI